MYLLRAEAEYGVNFATFQRIEREALTSLETALHQGSTPHRSTSDAEVDENELVEETMNLPEAFDGECLGKSMDSPPGAPGQDDLMQQTLLWRSATRLQRTTTARQVAVGRQSPLVPVAGQVRIRKERKLKLKLK